MTPTAPPGSLRGRGFYTNTQLTRGDMAGFYANKGPAAVSVAAAGTNQATGTALTLGCLNKVTAADGTKGVVLPSGVAGDVVRVYNSVATNGLPVYPPSSGTINGGSANAAVTIEGKTLALFECVDGTDWAAIYTANT